MFKKLNVILLDFIVKNEIFWIKLDKKNNKYVSFTFILGAKKNMKKKDGNNSGNNSDNVNNRKIFKRKIYVLYREYIENVHV